ncbi:MAG: hypothetical protein WA809_03215 [Candidatus Dormiibacterota bacterium]
MGIDDSGKTGSAWNRYGRALIHSMADVTPELPGEFHGLLLETADFWLSLGLAIGTQKRDQALSLLELIEAEEIGQVELAADAEAFCAEALA